VILAGGYGKRLLPITETTPKPLLPLGNSTVYGTITSALTAQGFTDISVATMYKAKEIEAYPVKGAKLSFFRESTPLGTAGCVKNAAKGITESFLVVSGDTVCDFNFRQIMEKHKASGAPISIVCTRVSRPTEYGTVLVNGSTISAFVEKPSWKRTLTNLVNTGVYVVKPQVLDMIGEGEQDFAHDLFPKLLAAGMPLHCIEETGYWCDIGDVESYYRCCFRAAGDVKNVVFGDAGIAPDAAVEGCILFDGAVVEGGSAVYDSIICENTVIGSHSFVGGGCVIGGGTLVGDGAYISGGTALKAGLNVEKGARVMKSIVFGEIRKRHLDGGRISGRYGSYINGEFCLTLGGALSYTAGAGAAIGVMHTGSAESRALADSILCGIRLYGGRAYDLEDGFASLCAFAAPQYGLAYSVMVNVNGNKASISIYDGDGLPPTHKEERAIEAAISRPVPTTVTAGETVRLDREERVKFRYADALVNLIPDLSGCTLYVGDRNTASEFLYSVAEKRGAKVEYGKGADRDTFYVSEDGFYAEAMLKDGVECSYWGLLCLGAGLGGEVALPTSAPQFVEQAVLKAGGKPVFYGDAGGREREAAYRCLWSCDGNGLALRALYAGAVANKPLAQLYGDIPKQVVEIKTLRCDEDSKARTMEKLCTKGCGGRGGEGVMLKYASGSVVVVPLNGGGFRLFAEAVSTEAAEEIFDLTEKEINKAEQE